MQTTAWPFIEINDSGRPMIQGTRFKALLLVQEHLLYAWNAEQLQRQHPQLNLSQIHAALGYCYEHQAECDEMLAQDRRHLESLRILTESPVLMQRLRLLKSET